MTPRLYPIELPELPGRLAITRRPRGFEHLDADVASWRAAGIDTIVSLLEVDEARDIGLDVEGAACARHGIAFVSVPLGDFGIPATFESVETAVERLAEELKAGHYVAFHCFASVGRSPLLAAATLIRAGIGGEQALERLSQARGRDVPETAEQHAWVFDYEVNLRGLG